MHNQFVSTGINGFGRFGEHLLKYWVENYSSCAFSIDYINSNSLPLKLVYEKLTHDEYLSSFYKNQVSIHGNFMHVALKNKVHKIEYSQTNDGQIPWLGKPELFFECTGRNTNAQNCEKFIVGKTKHVIISATSLNAQKTLIYGLNHKSFETTDKIISYGSCTVNAYTPLALYINKKYKIIDSDVNVIHNTPTHLHNVHRQVIRKDCTLLKSAPTLLPFLSTDNFNVNYTTIPYTGVSSIDIRFRLQNAPTIEHFIEAFQHELKNGSLYGIYNCIKTDSGPQQHKFSPFSATIIETQCRIIGNNLYIHAYFDNENSVNRFYDLANFIAQHYVLETTQ